MLHHALLKLLHIFFTNFDLDFRGQEDHPNPPAADVKNSSCMLQVNLTCLYRLLPGWINRYDQMFNTPVSSPQRNPVCHSAERTVWGKSAVALKLIQNNPGYQT